MSGFPGGSASSMGNFLVNPGGATLGALETAMRGPAWWLLDMSPLWGFPALRGDNTVVPHAPGRRSNKRRYDQGVYVMPFRVTGSVTVSGAVTAVPSDPIEGLQTNLDYLWENVHNPPTTATRNGKLIRANASETTLAVQTSLALVKQTIQDAVLLFEVIVPDGRF